MTAFYTSFSCPVQENHAPQKIFALGSIECMGIAEKIKELRERMDISQKELARRCGVSYQAVQQWEKQDGTAPKRTRLDKVAGVLGVSVSELVSEGEDRYPGMRKEAQELIDELIHLATADKLADGDIVLLRSIIDRLSDASPRTRPPDPLHRRESDWIIGGKELASSRRKKQ
jgi:transcriptional regulator with XRE-family HTH domain